MSLDPQVAGTGMSVHLLKILEDQAKATGQIAELLRQGNVTSVELRTAMVEHTQFLAKIADTLERIETDQKEGRGAAVKELKKHIDERTQSGGWQSIAAWVFAGSAALGSAALAALATIRVIRG